jgi:hypothetical protein
MTALFSGGDTTASAWPLPGVAPTPDTTGQWESLADTRGLHSAVETTSAEFDANCPAPDSPSTAVDWSPFGLVLPVLSGSPGAGASVFSALAADVLQQAGRCALLVDTAEPSRSGLAAAAAITGAEVAYPAAGVGVRWSWRGHAVVAQMETDLEPLAPVPPFTPAEWLPPSGLVPLHVTIADVGQGWCAPTDAPLTGPGSWLAAGTGADTPCPVLVVRATRPSLLAAEAALARMDPWVSAGQAVFPIRLVVMASWKRKWPKGVAGVAGARVSSLLDDAVFVPHDEELLLGGISEHPTPPRAQAAVAQLLHEWGLLTPGPTSNTRTRATTRGAQR